MRIPKKILSSGHDVIVKKMKGGTLSTIEQAGAFSAWDNEIFINTNGTSESTQAEAFLHEIVENINMSNELKLKHTAITILASQLFAIIRNNKLDFRK